MDGIALFEDAQRAAVHRWSARFRLRHMKGEHIKGCDAKDMRRIKHNATRGFGSEQRENLTCKEHEDFLCVLKNTSSERFSFSFFSCAPAGKCFTLSQEVTLEPLGQSAFITCLAHDSVIRTPFGMFTLLSSNGIPSLSPETGLAQKIHLSSIAGLPRIVLICKFWSTAQQLHEISSIYETVPDLLKSLPSCNIFRELWERNPPSIPEESTVFILQDNMLHEDDLVDTITEHGLERFVIPSTLFVRSGSNGEILTQDNSSKVSFRGEDNSIVVQIYNSGKWPLLILTGSRIPYRLNNIWVVCYVVQRIL